MQIIHIQIEPRTVVFDGRVCKLRPMPYVRGFPFLRIWAGNKFPFIPNFCSQVKNTEKEMKKKNIVLRHRYCKGDTPS